MKLIIDQDAATLTVEDAARGDARVLDLHSDEAFELIAEQYVRVGWNQKQVYTYSWMGRPIIQLPDDMVRMQEVIWRLRPDLIVETGIAHGGSLIFYASLCQAMGHGRVLGIDIEIRPHNRAAIEAHEMYPRIDMIEGSSVDPDVVARAREAAEGKATVLVILDSNHSYDHVMAELKAYAPLVSVGSYIVAMDGIMGEVVGAPRTEPDWATNNPTQAAIDFVAENPNFRIVEPAFPFNEGDITERVTYWPGAYIQRQS